MANHNTDGRLGCKLGAAFDGKPASVRVPTDADENGRCPMKYTLNEAHVITDGENTFIAPNAALIGRVRLEKNASVWWNAVLRGDNEWITVGKNSNVQDGCVLHTDAGFPLTIGHNVSVGHMAVLHGCRIGDNSLIGIGSIVLNGATVGSHCLIGAGTLIPEGKTIPDNSVVFGTPGRVVRQTTAKDRAYMADPAKHYVQRISEYNRGLKVDES